MTTTISASSSSPITSLCQTESVSSPKIDPATAARDKRTSVVLILIGVMVLGVGIWFYAWGERGMLVIIGVCTGAAAIAAGAFTLRNLRKLGR